MDEDMSQFSFDTKMIYYFSSFLSGPTVYCESQLSLSLFTKKTSVLFSHGLLCYESFVGGVVTNEVIRCYTYVRRLN